MLRRLRTWLADTTAWLVAEPVRLLVVGGGLAAGSVAGIPVGDKAFDYTWRDPRFCDDCHIHDYANEAWAASVHASLTTCHDCHRVPISHYPRNLWMTAFDRPEGAEDIHAPHIPVVVCGQCHLPAEEVEPLSGPMPPEVQLKVVKVEDSPLHKAHLESETHVPAAYAGGKAGEEPRRIDCMDCHGSTDNSAHRFEASTENCVACHQELKAPEHGPGTLPCMQCHITGFLEEK